jgi:hypothetical protein
MSKAEFTVRYTWEGEIKIEAENEDEALMAFDKMLMEDEFTHIMDLELSDERSEIV